MTINLKENLGREKEYPWDGVCATTMWFLWRWRNKGIFKSCFRRPKHPMRSIQCYVKNYIQGALLEHRTRPFDGANSWHDNWIPPAKGWWKINIDTSRNLNKGLMTCVGIIRDQNGEWSGAFFKFLEDMEIGEAEAWAILEGMQWAWNKGIRKVIVIHVEFMLEHVDAQLKCMCTSVENVLPMLKIVFNMRKKK